MLPEANADVLLKWFLWLLLISYYTYLLSLCEMLESVINYQNESRTSQSSGPAFSVISKSIVLFLFVCLFVVQVSSSNATTISQPILQLSGDSQTQVAQVAQGQELNAAAGQTLQSVQLVNPGTFLIQAQTVTATGQIQWQTFQVSRLQRAGRQLLFLWPSAEV